MALPVYGWGSPSKNVQPGQFYDWGWGSKTPSAGPVAKGIDFGWGDKSGAGTTALIVLPVVAGKQFPDDGGVILNLAASWYAVAGKGPYRVRLRESFGGQAYWPKDEFGCWGLQYGKGFECTPNALGDKLSFMLPVVPPGVYDIEVAWGPGWGTKLTAAQALRILWRGRGGQFWSIRQGFPVRLPAGPRASTAEKLLGVP